MRALSLSLYILQGRFDPDENDAPPTKQGLIERAKDVIKNGCVGAVLVLRDGIMGVALFAAGFGEQIVEAVDRWDDSDDGGLRKAIPITLILGIILLVWVSAYLSRKLGGRLLGFCRRWSPSPTHQD